MPLILTITFWLSVFFPLFFTVSCANSKPVDYRELW